MTSNSTQLPGSANPFQYTPLDRSSKQIRLVEIKPAVNDKDPLQLALKVVSLDSYPQPRPAPSPYGEPSASYEASTDDYEVTDPFTALSYVWGAETPSHVISIEQGRHHGCMSIRQNLYDFLKTIRDCSVHNQWFWIDQICINQTNDEEKGHQVTQMSDVYTKATTVEVWLGLAFEGSDWVLEFFTKGLSLEDLDSMQNDPAVVEHRSALQRFLTLPYWSRLWVVQEISLNQKTELRVGTETIPWDGNLRQMGLLFFMGPMAKSGWIEEPKQLPIFAFFVLRLIRSSMNWTDVWDIAARRECFHNRDKAFGVMSLLPENLRFHPDYTLSLTDVLINILDRTVSAQLEAGCKDGRGLEYLAIGWYRVLDPCHNEIDPEVVRKFLLYKAHPALRAMPQTLVPYWQRRWDAANKRLELYRTQTLVDCLHFGVGARPSWLLRTQLWWMFPDRKSKRWCFEFGDVERKLTFRGNGQYLLHG